MATQPADVEWRLALTDRQSTIPERRPSPAPAPAPAQGASGAAAAPPARAALARVLALARSLRGARRPSWLAVFVLVGAVAGAMWWWMSQQLDTAPRALIDANLASARLAASERSEGMMHTALHHYRTVLALDPENAEASEGVAQLVERYVARAKTAIQDGRIADAVVALDALRQTDPAHRRLPLLIGELSRAIEQRAFARESAVDRPLSASPATERKAPTAANARRATTEQPPATRTAERTGERDALAESANTLPEARAAAPTAGPKSAREGASTDSAPELAMLAALTPAQADASKQSEDGADISSSASRGGAAAGIEPRIEETTIDPVAPPAPMQTGAAPPPPRRLVKYVQPDYPREALMRGIEGWVEVSLSVSPSGDVMEPRVEDGRPRQIFERPALNAVRHWKYEARPGAMSDQPMQVRVTFALEE